MSELGDLLELLHGAGTRFERVICEYRTWRHDERASAAFRADAERSGSTTFAAVGLESDEPAPAEHEDRVRVWLEKPDKVREEHVAGYRLGTYGVRVGELWWMYDEHSGARTNEGDEKVGSGIGQQLESFLNPEGLIPLLDIRVAGRSECAGRATIWAIATPRPVQERHFGFQLHALGSGADEYELQVDAETGVLVRAEARRHGEPFVVHEALAIDFDRPIAPETFVFEPPSGEELQPLEWNRPFLHDIPVHDAAARAPFPVFVLDRVPADWKLTASFHPGTTRPSSAPSVHLHYRAENATSGVNISQIPEEDREDWGWGSNAPEWQDVDREGLSMRVRSRADTWGQSQLVFVREGTAITMLSESLDGEALVRLADSLVPAPSDPPAI